jgi:hypothetical protein
VTRSVLWAFVPPARWFSPVRLLIAAMLLVVAGTAALTIHLTRRGELTGDIVAARRAWMKHLEAGDFAKARPVLEQAAAEIKRYGEDSHDWREVDQLAREVALFSELPEQPWAELLQVVRSMSPADSSEYFRDKLEHPPMIFDVYVSPSGDGLAAFRVDTMIFLGQEAARLDLTDFKLFKSLAPGLSTRFVFGARIRSIERSADSTVWVIHLVPDSGVMITSDVCLDKVGWPIDDGTRSVLEDQKKRVLE